MGNSQSCLEQNLATLSFESLQDVFNQKVTGVDPADKSVKMMTRADFSKQFPTLSQQRIFGQHSFSLFDIEQMGSVDFSQFFGGLTVLLNQKVDTKLDALFRLLDVAGNGILEEYELLGFVEKTLGMIKEIDATVMWDESITIPKTQQELNDLIKTTSSNNTYNSNNKNAQNNNNNKFEHAEEYLFVEKPLTLGPIEVCLDSQQLLNYGFASIGKPLPNTIPASTSQSATSLTLQAPVVTGLPSRGGGSSSSITEPSTPRSASIDDQLQMSFGTGSRSSRTLQPSQNQLQQQSATSLNGNNNTSQPQQQGTRTMSKREFVQFIHSTPQLLFTVMWAMNVSFVQHICKQTRLEFIQQCEQQIVSAFPLNEQDLIQQYTRMSSFFYEVLIRRLGLINRIQPTSLLQQDLSIIKQYFKTATTNGVEDDDKILPVLEGRSGSFSRNNNGSMSNLNSPSADSTSSRRRSRGGLFGLYSESSADLAAVTTTIDNDAPRILLPKVSSLTYPFTYHLTDNTLHQPILNSSLLSNHVQGTGNTPAQQQPNAIVGVSVVSDGSDVLSANSGTYANSLANAPTKVQSNFLTTTDQDLYNNIILSTCGTINTWNVNSPVNAGAAVDLNRTNFFPDTLPFFLYFTQVFKLQHLIHRNRIASRTKCTGLLRNITHILNTEYVDLIAKQYLFEVQCEYNKSQRTTKLNSNTHEGELNNKLLCLLNERKAEKEKEQFGNNKTNKDSNSNQTDKNNNSNNTNEQDDGVQRKKRKNRALSVSASMVGSPSAMHLFVDSDDEDDKSPQIKNKKKISVNTGVVDTDSDDDDDDAFDLTGLDQFDVKPKKKTTDKESSKTKDNNNSSGNSRRRKDIIQEDDEEQDDSTASGFGTRKTSKTRNSNNSNKNIDKDESNTTRPKRDRSRSASRNRNSKNDGSTTIKMEIEPAQPVGFDKEALKNEELAKQQQQQGQNIEDFDASQLVDPGAGHLMTEGMIPQFLSTCTKKIHIDYLPYARGPHAVVCLEEFIQKYIPDALGQLLAAYRHVVHKKINTKFETENRELLTNISDYINELLLFKTTFKEQLQKQQFTIEDLEGQLTKCKQDFEELQAKYKISRAQLSAFHIEMLDVVSVKDVAIITLRDEMQFYVKEQQHWSDHISRLEREVKQLKSERVQKDIEIAQLRAQTDQGCCSIM